MNKRLIFFACTGLGRINRGYETFTHECFQALQSEPGLDLYLFKGAGESSPREKALFNFHRGAAPANLLAKMFKKDAYFFEQFTFFLSFLPHVLFRKPEVIFYSDFIFGCFLWNIRKKLGLKFKL
ncbi:MAG TPA: hypothetical protein VIT23_02725, partial [Terrimicrobiaceae bacterium]